VISTVVQQLAPQIWLPICCGPVANSAIHWGGIWMTILAILRVFPMGLTEFHAAQNRATIARGSLRFEACGARWITKRCVENHTSRASDDSSRSR
jgi:hypothetical protein